MTLLPPYYLKPSHHLPSPHDYPLKVRDDSNQPPAQTQIIVKAKHSSVNAPLTILVYSI